MRTIATPKRVLVIHSMVLFPRSPRMAVNPVPIDPSGKNLHPDSFTLCYNIIHIYINEIEKRGREKEGEDTIEEERKRMGPEPSKREEREEDGVLGE